MSREEEEERDPDKHMYDDGEEYFSPRRVKEKRKGKRKQQPKAEFPPSTQNRTTHTVTDTVAYYNLGATFVMFYNHVEKGDSLAPIFDSKQETL